MGNKDFVLYQDGCEGCDFDSCQDCCPHDVTSNFICVVCCKELDPGDFIS